MPGGARLSGRVTDPNCGPLEGARVRGLEAKCNVAAEASADGNGQYEFAGRPDGVWRVEAAVAGFQTAAVNGIAASGGAVLQWDARLQVGSAMQTVDVTATAEPVLNMLALKAGVRSSRNAGSGEALGSGAELAMMCDVVY